jgi:hypothetical protein
VYGQADTVNLVPHSAWVLSLDSTRSWIMPVCDTSTKYFSEKSQVQPRYDTHFSQDVRNCPHVERRICSICITSSLSLRGTQFAIAVFVDDLMMTSTDKELVIHMEQILLSTCGQFRTSCEKCVSYLGCT